MVLSLLLGLVVPSILCVGAKQSPYVTAVVSPFTSVTQSPIPPNMIGWSIETYWTNTWIAPQTTPRPQWVALITQLMLTAGQRGPAVRVGGNSGDQSVWNPDGRHPHPNLPSGPPWLYNITLTDMARLKSAMIAINGSLVLGLNLRQQYNASLAIDYVRAIDEFIGWKYVGALEIGNEVDSYGHNGIRPPGYDYAAFQADCVFYMNALRQAVPTMPKRIIQGGAVAGDGWVRNYTDLARALGADTFTSMANHHYPTTHCGNNNVTINEMLSQDFANKEAKALTQLGIIPQLRQLAIPFVNGEGNSASCYGSPGTSNAFVSALWAVDLLFNIALAGVQSWAWTCGGPVRDSAFKWDTPEQEQVVVEPMYYGLRLFALATANHANIVPTDVTTDDHIIVWSTYAETTGAIQVVLLHKNPDETESALVTISFRHVRTVGAAATATVIRMIAPSLSSEFNITLAGQTYDNTKDGFPIGDYIQEIYSDDGQGKFLFNIDPRSAVLFTYIVGSIEEEKQVQSK